MTARPPLFALVVSIVLIACSDGAKKRPIGSTCSDSDDCASGLCYESQCLDPQGDDDADELVNTIEVALGTDPFEPDSDGDGVADRAELDDALAHEDTDGDGKPDALESVLADADLDCVNDEQDPNDDDPGEGEGATLVATACGTPRGVCASEGATLAARCPDGLGAPVCHYGGVPGYAAVDDDCDGEDDDCDGTADDAGTCTTYPEGCEDVAPRVDGTYTIDPDGAGPYAPIEVECLFSEERGDWTRYTAVVRDAIATLAEPGELREYLMHKDGAWYRSPLSMVAWRWDDGAPLGGLWLSERADGTLGGFDCEFTEALPAVGVGCMWPDGPTLEVTTGDATTGTATVCTLAQDVFTSPCATDVEIYVRFAQCVPDEGQLLEDGGFSGFADGGTCWFAFGDGEPLQHFAFDTDVPSDGSAPSLRADNPTLGNDIFALEAGQAHLSLLAGRAYVWGFWAKAAEARTIRPFLQSRDLSVYIYNADVPIGTTWGYHELSFISPGSTFDGMLSFQLGEVSTASVWLDEVSLVDVGANVCTPREGAVLVDGDFDLPALFCWEVFKYNQGIARGIHDHSEVPPGGVAPSLRVEHSPGTQVPADAGIIQRNLFIPANRELRLVFWLKATAPTAVGYGLGDGAGYPGGFVNDVGATWQAYTFDFSSGAGTPAGTGSLQFQVGSPNAVTVWIDGVDIIDLGPTPVR